MFDGTNDHVLCTDANCGGTTKLDIGTSNWTIAAWVKTTSIAARKAIVSKGTGAGQFSYELELDVGIPQFFLYNTANGAYMSATGTQAVNDGNWHYVVGTYDGTTIRVYADGILQGSSTTTTGVQVTNSTSNFIIGARTDDAAQYFIGAIDAVSVYARALPDHEILSNYNIGSLEFQTRVGSDTTPNDGTNWEDWKPATSETQIFSFDNVQGIATPSASIWHGALVATSSSTILKMEGNGALKAQTGAITPNPNHLALWHLDETSGTGAYLKDTSPTGDTPSGSELGDGADGSVSITAATNINTTAIAAGRPTCLSGTACADGIAYRVVAPADSATSVTRFSGSDTISNGIAAGDEVLLINLQGTSSDFADVGNYEIKGVQSVSASTITFTSAITSSYDGTTASNQKVVIQRVPNYTNVTLSSSGSLTASAWEALATTPSAGAGYLTGIVALRASGTISIGSSNSITANSLGYRPGAVNPHDASPGYANGGESYLGTAGLGPFQNGGGGGGSHSGLSGSYWGNGGGGAGYGGAGAIGAIGAANPNAAALGGSTYGDENLTKIYLGSSGGSSAASGGRGGGIIILYANEISGSGTVTSTGAAGTQSSADASGSGSGGSIKAITNTLGATAFTVAGGASTAGAGSGGAGGAGGVGRSLISSFASHITPASGTSVVDGVVSKARSFNGSSDYMTAPNTAELDFPNHNLTISLWLKPGSTQGANADIFSKHATTANSGYGFEMNGAANSNVYYFFWGTGSGFQCTGTTVTLTPNVWQHVAIVKSELTSIIYINGDRSATCTATSSTIAKSADLLTFARLGSGSSRFWNGSMDEVMFSDTVATSNEIAEMFRAGRDHRFTTSLSSTDLSTKKRLPFYVAGDRPGTYLEARVGEGGYPNYMPDTSTVGLWHLDEDASYPHTPLTDSRAVFNDTFPGSSLDTTKWVETDPSNNKISVNNGLVLSAGVAAAWDSAVISRQVFTNTTNNVLYARYTTGSSVAAPNHFMVGWGQDQFADPAYTAISHAFYFDAGTFRVYQDGVLTATVGSGFVANTTYEVKITINVTSGTAKYEVKGGIYVDWTTLLSADSAKTNTSFRAHIAQFRAIGTMNEITVYQTDSLKDSSSSSNHAQYSGATFVQGKIGGARRFDGTNDYVLATSQSNLNFNQADAFTVEAWVNPAALGAQRYIINKQENVTNELLITLQMTAANKFEFVIGKQNVGSTSALGTTVFGTGLWHHVVGVSDGTTIFLYVDGMLEASTTISISGTTQSVANLQFGRLYNGTLLWSGLIDEVRVSNVARTANEIRQAFENGRRTHPITIDFAAGLDGGNLITGSGDTSFTVDATDYGLNSMGSGLYLGDKIIIKENVDGTEYVAQGTVTGITVSSGATTVVSWDSGSTFPSGGYTANASVFKWQREYWDITGPLDSQIDAITDMTFRITNGGEGRTIFIDDLRSAGDYLTTPTGSTPTSGSPLRYMQYRSIFSSSDTGVSPSLRSATVDYNMNTIPATPTLDSPADAATNQALSPVLRTTTTDADGDYLQYKIELCTNVGMTTGCQTFNQVSSQTGWSGQNAASSTAYTSGTQAVYTIQTPLSAGTTYYWRSYAFDPEFGSTFSGTQGTPRSFTTSFTPGTPTLNAPADGATNQILSPILRTTATDADSDYIRYKIELCTNVGMTTGCQTFDQTVSQTGWSGQNTQGGTAYTSGTQGVYTIQTPLSHSTTYYWRSYAIDPGGSNTFGNTQGTPFSFTTTQPSSAPTLLWTNDQLNPVGVNPNVNPYFSAIYNDPDASDTAVKYQIQVSINSDFVNVTHWDSGLTSMTSTAQGARSPNITYAGTALSFNTVYYWRIRFQDAGGQTGSYSAINTFTTTGLFTVNCRLEKNRTNTEIIVRWSNTNTANDGYTVEKSTDGGAFASFTTTGASGTSATDSTVTSGHTYAYRVKATYTASSSDWCTTSTVSLQTGRFGFEGLRMEGLRID